MAEWWPLLIQVLVVIITGGGGWFLLRSQRGKINAETRSTTVETMSMITEELRIELARCRAQIKTLQAEVASLHELRSTEIAELAADLAKVQRRLEALSHGVFLLTQQIEALGYEPVWKDEEGE